MVSIIVGYIALIIITFIKTFSQSDFTQFWTVSILAGCDVLLYHIQSFVNVFRSVDTLKQHFLKWLGVRWRFITYTAFMHTG